MPYISSEEYMEYKRLKEKERREQEVARKFRDWDLNELARKVGGLLDLNKHLGPIEAYARVMQKMIKKQMIYEKTDTLFFNWSDMQRYLTEQCLEIDQYGKINMKQMLRTRLREFGYECRINRQYNTFTIKKCEVKKYGKS